METGLCTNGNSCKKNPVALSCKIDHIAKGYIFVLSHFKRKIELNVLYIRKDAKVNITIMQRMPKHNVYLCGRPKNFFKLLNCNLLYFHYVKFWLGLLTVAFQQNQAFNF